MPLLLQQCLQKGPKILPLSRSLEDMEGTKPMGQDIQNFRKSSPCSVHTFAQTTNTVNRALLLVSYDDHAWLMLGW